MATQQPSGPDVMVWTDLETTGLDQSYGAILEIGMMVTDWLGNPLGQKSSLVIDPYVLPRALSTMPPEVEEMHTKSGLLKEIMDLSGLSDENRGQYHPAVVEQGFINWLTNGIGLSAFSNPMCGSTVSFDRRWLKEHMPNLEQWFHYREVDMSGLKTLCRGVNASVAKALPEKRNIHRSIPDLQDSIRDYVFYLDNFLMVHMPEVDEDGWELVEMHKAAGPNEPWVERRTRLEVALAAQPETAKQIDEFLKDPSTGVVWQGRDGRRTRIVNE